MWGEPRFGTDSNRESHLLSCTGAVLHRKQPTQRPHQGEPTMSSQDRAPNDPPTTEPQDSAEPQGSAGTHHGANHTEEDVPGVAWKINDPTPHESDVEDDELHGR